LRYLSFSPFYTLHFPLRITRYFTTNAISREPYRVHFGRPLQPPILLIIGIVVGVGGDRRQLLAGADLPQADLPAELVGVHDDGEHVDAAVRYRLTGAIGDAVALGDHLWLTWRYYVPPVRIDADAENAGVVSAQAIRVEESQAAAVADEGVQLRVGVVGLQHEVARPRVRIERVSSLRRIIKALRTQEEAMDYAEAGSK